MCSQSSHTPFSLNRHFIQPFKFEGLGNCRTNANNNAKLAGLQERKVNTFPQLQLWLAFLENYS